MMTYTPLGTEALADEIERLRRIVIERLRRIVTDMSCRKISLMARFTHRTGMLFDLQRCDDINRLYPTILVELQKPDGTFGLVGVFALDYRTDDEIATEIDVAMVEASKADTPQRSEDLGHDGRVIQATVEKAPPIATGTFIDRDNYVTAICDLHRTPPRAMLLQQPGDS